MVKYCDLAICDSVNGVHARERILNVYNWDTKGRFMDKLFDDLEGKSHE